MKSSRRDRSQASGVASPSETWRLSRKLPSARCWSLLQWLPCAGWYAFTDETTDLRPSNAAAHAYTFSISPEYFHAASTALLSGRTFTWHDDKNAPPVAVVNQEFAHKVFGSAANAMGRYFKRKDG